MIGKKSIYWLSLITIFGFSAIGWSIIYFWQDSSLLNMLKGNMNLGLQVLLGFAYGFVTALIGWLLITSSLLKNTRQKYGKLIRDLKLNNTEIILISICAGVGEEILFRGGIQPLMGIWITSIVFVAIHGYLNPMNWRMSIYGIYMTLIIAGMGYFAKYLGLTMAIAAHVMVDIVLLYLLTHDKSGEDEGIEEEINNDFPEEETEWLPDE